MRLWSALDLGTTRVILLGRASRVVCPDHGVVAADVPWARPNAEFTKAFEERCVWLSVHNNRSAVTPLMRREGLRSQTGYPRRSGHYGGKPAVVSPNHLDRQFDVAAPNVAWVTDITYILTYEGWLYLSVVIDLFSRQVVGWSMKPRMTTDLALDALLAAVWRRKPQGVVIVDSDQGSQFSSTDRQSFLKANYLMGSMSLRGNCHDSAVAESFFQLLKRERVKRKIYSTREVAKSDVFDYIEMFYHPRRRHSTSDDLSSVEYERRHFQSLTGG